MKRKRDSLHINDPQVCDLVLTDAKGRSVLVHKALLIDRSDYFARLLAASDVDKVQLNENYLIELIDYLYRCDSDSKYESGSSLGSANDGHSVLINDSASIDHGDIEILLQLLVLAKKYEFEELHRKLMIEIDVKLGPATVLAVYRYAAQLNIEDLLKASRVMILSLLPQLHKSEDFTSLPEELIDDLFNSEAPDIESESKLNALSAWWSRNKDADKTDLWAKLVTCAYND